MRDGFPDTGQVVLPTADDTQRFAEDLAGYLRAGDVVILDGPVGAGKTTFTQGLARGLKVKGRVTSPTFVIARVHKALAPGAPALVHVDAYRLLGQGEQEVDPTGALDSLDLDTDLEGAIVVAEWGGGLMEQLSSSYLAIAIDRSNEERVLSWRWVAQDDSHHSV